MTCEWEIFLFAGTNPADKITLRVRRGSLELRRSAKSAFRPASKTNDNIDTALDDFFDLSPFAIDRANVRNRHTHAHTRTHARTHARTHTHSLSHARTHTHAHTLSHIQVGEQREAMQQELKAMKASEKEFISDTHSLTHTHTHTHKHT